MVLGSKQSTGDASSRDGKPPRKSSGEKIALSGEVPCLLRPGVYDLVFERRWLGKVHGNAFKLALWFRVVQPGDGYGARVARFYNIKQADRSRRHFSVGPHSDFVREYRSLFPGALRTLRDIPVEPFRNVIVRGRIKTVDTDRHQNSLPDAIRYSVVEALLEIGAGQ